MFSFSLWPLGSEFVSVRRAFCVVELNRTGHMSFLTRQDRTPKFAGQVLPDRSESGPIFFNILPNKYWLSILIDKVPGHKFGIKSSKLGCI